MVRPQGARRLAWHNRLLLGAAGLVAVGAAIVFAAASIADAIVGSQHPTMHAAVVWTVIGLIVVSIVALWWKWNRRRRSRYSRLPELLALTPRQFEEAIGALLHDSGFKRVQRVGGSGDLCADLTAIDPDGQHVVVQCKRHAPGSKIGSGDIQKFLGMTVVHHRANRGIFATTSEFTRPAVELASAHPIELWDGAYLSQKLEGIHRRVVKQ